MAIDYDIDELDDDTEVGYSEGAVEDYGSDYEPDGEGIAFDDIDFEALGIDPNKPTAAKPGSEEKVLMLAARYAAGIPLWHDKDCYDHGPGEFMLRMLNPVAQKN